MNVQKLICILLLITLITVAGCVPGDGKHTTEKPAGFFWGIWHGWIAPISLIWQLFNPDIRLYEPNNTGWWYDFGFYIAIISGFGGISLTRRKRKKVVVQDSSNSE
ncbi:MAG: hypothetical protein OXN25_24765 [Candidatus Poribacteria bacterium]|nr:hypothetical protein [Candidatus Poribacteria bacterium]